MHAAYCFYKEKRIRFMSHTSLAISPRRHGPHTPAHCRARPPPPRQFESGLFGTFQRKPLQSGSEQWRVEIVKPLATQPVHGVDSCCGACGGS
jgi:hypothetical protein